jgi:ABC-2 type transport system ATP-binding protein
LSKFQNEYCISAYNLRKQYSRNTDYVLDNITFNVKNGTVFGFLGPNGAGKTTTLKILTTTLSLSSGSVYIFGKDLFKNQLEIKRRIGVVTQNPSYEANLTTERALDLYGMLWGLRDKKTRKRKVDEVLRTFDLESIRNSKNDELSIGQRRRVQVAREFMHEMDLLFLDEPTVGLDPSARRQLLDYIKAHVKSGLTVFFTTHIMEEAEYLCNEIAIIDRGRIIAFDTPNGLKQKYGGGAKTIELTFKDTLDEYFVNLLKGTINKKNGNKNNGSDKRKSNIDVNGKHTIRITVSNVEEIISEILQVVSRHDLQIESIAINPPSLEEVFLSIVNDENKPVNK